MPTHSKDHQIIIRPDGAAVFVYDDALAPLAELGMVEIRRASHVEPVIAPDKRSTVWGVDFSPLGVTSRHFQRTREAALESERGILESWLRRTGGRLDLMAIGGGA